MKLYILLKETMSLAYMQSYKVQLLKGFFLVIFYQRYPILHFFAKRASAWELIAKKHPSRLKVNEIFSYCWVTKLILWLCFRPFYQKKKNFFFEKPRNFLVFLCVLDPGDHFTKSRPASCGKIFNQEKFHFQIISKPFDRSTSYLVWW